MSEEVNNKWKTLMNVWLEGALNASTFILATQVKFFTHMMSNVATDLFMQASKEEYGSEIAGTETIAQAMENYMMVEVQMGIAANGDLSFQQKDAHTVDITVKDCPYGVACGHFISALQETGDFSKDDIPCLRANCYEVAVARMTGAECYYRLLQFAPGIRCRARLEVV
jgi:hypothetical protein